VTGAAGSPGATSHIDVCITGASGNDYIIDAGGNAVTCTGANSTGSDPVQILIVGNLASAAGNTAPETVGLVIGLADGTPAPARIKVAVEDDGAGSAINAFPANSATPTLQGHPGAAGAAAVGAAFYFYTPACGTSPATLEPFSSQGGEPLLFDSKGNRLSAPVTRQKPDFVGPDGGNDTFLGYTLASDGFPGGRVDTSIAACQNDAAYPNFFGTSAATPHVAAIAALMLQANASATPDQIYSALRGTALPMGGTPGFNFDSGYGFVQADAAIGLIPPGAPTLSAAAASVHAGTATTLTWTSVNASGCTAAGAWSGAVAASGSQPITPSAVGTETYTLICANAAGSSAPATVTVEVTAASSSGGGGALDAAALGLLASFAAARWLLRAWPSSPCLWRAPGRRKRESPPPA
jgi:hypothetical protein